MGVFDEKVVNRVCRAALFAAVFRTAQESGSSHFWKVFAIVVTQ